MYKITCFVRVGIEEFQEHLKHLGFIIQKNSYEIRMDGTYFRIIPFQLQSPESYKGYRVYFNSNYVVGSYIYNYVFRFENFITGIECRLPNISEHSIERLFKKTGPGMYEKNKIGICVLEDTVVLIKRSKKGKHLPLLETITKIDSIREQIFSSIEIDLFSLSKQKKLS